ncbi:UDP-N-acetylglucosamine 2-epimerase [Ramlibacter sp. WS9]|uniref:UDP-N-acetylglucosamine 2-epimerase n=1 Tax=Ramlibacter sp. WS9 TaxID=1882741 RepID=UPI001141C1AD|nr:UDP-N-acetylglucosamine 2-epimerase [Ramlibacter sp. WS9]ROZ63660.1 UDP-N-acetylglucosamine 2-epimerase (hydrolyzing) [Ramlibacter sp. WS9]
MKVAVVTGSRSEYGILKPVIDVLRSDSFFDVEVIATGSHLSAEFGMTVTQIEADGIEVRHRVEMLLSSDTGVGMAKSTGLGVIGFADTLATAQPEWVLLLGDRYEILAAAQASLMLGIPVAHIGGGDVTEGAIDDAMRHAITKMSHLHFATHESAAQLIAQLGEEPERIHWVGNPGLDAILGAPQATLAELHAAGYTVGANDLLVSLHPETLGDASGLGTTAALARETTQALEEFASGSTVWLALPNADPQGRELGRVLRQWADGKPWVHVYPSVPARIFRGLMAHCRAMVGNSSAALAEAPSLGLPAVNIGARQGGRLAGASVIHTQASAPAIVAAIRQAMAMKGQPFVNPYGDGKSSQRIADVLKASHPARNWLRKRFHRMDTAKERSC